MAGKRLILSFLFALILAFGVNAQSISIKGRVEDTANKPIAGATVVLRNQKTGLERIVTTDGEGRFVFNASESGNYEAIATATGFERVVKPVTGPMGEIVLTLGPEPLKEEVTVVSGSRQEELRESLNTKVEVLSAEEIRSTGYQNVGEVLREIPGVVTRRGSETSGVAGEQVQGIDSRQVLVLADGQPLVGARGIKLGALNLDRQSVGRLESIEVVKGASSALYGSDAIGGVINLITREPDKPFSLALTAAGGSFGAVDLAGIGSFKRDRLSGILSLERHKNNGFDLNPATFQAEGAGFHRYDTYGKLKYQFTDNFSLMGFANSYWNSSKGQVVGESGPQYNDIEDQSQNYGVTADWAIDGRTNLQIRGYFSRFDEYTFGKLYPSNAPVDDGNLFERYGKFDATFSRLIGERQFVQVGAELVTDRYSGFNRLQNNEARADTRVFWLQDKINIIKRLTLTIGGRYDDHSVFGSAVSPKIGLNYKLANWASLRASWGRGFRAPDLGQLYYRLTNPTNFYQVIGNPNLSPEHSGSWQVGGEFNGFKRKARLGINYFRNDVRNLINSQSLGFVTQANVDTLFATYGIDPSLRQFITYNLLLFYYRNLAQVYTTGGEVDGGYTLPCGFSVGGAYTYLDARDKTTNRFLTSRNRHQGLVKLAFENARLGINANLRGSFYSKWIVSRVESTNVETIAPAFQLWDLYGSKRLKKGFELYGTIDNLFDNRDRNSGTTGPIYRPESGRIFRVGVRWTLDSDK